MRKKKNQKEIKKENEVFFFYFSRSSRSTSVFPILKSISTASTLIVCFPRVSHDPDISWVNSLP